MGAYSNRVIADGASHYWRLGESSGLTAVAAVGGANGTISGGVTLGQPGAIADGTSAMLFNGTTGKIVTTAAAVVVPCTIEAWVKVAAFAGSDMVFWGTNYSGPQQEWVLRITSGGSASAVLFAAGQAQQTVVNSTTPITVGVWHHLAFVFQPTVVTIYVDGALQGTGASAFTLTGMTLPVTLGGKTDTSQFFPGALDDIAIYPRALTVAEVSAHYAIGRTTEVTAQGPYADRVISDGASNYWRLNEASGLSAVDSVGGKTGTISGGVTLGQPSPLGDGTSAMLFNGSTGKIATAAVLLPVAFTLEAWVKRGAGGPTDTIWSNYVAGQVGPIQWAVISTGFLQLYMEGQTDAVIVGSRSLNDNVWHHCMAVVDGAMVRLYVDGQLDVAEASSHTSTAPATAAVIGATGAGQFFTGALDEVAIYPRALSASEVAAHYALSTVPVPRDLNTGLYTYLLGVFGLSAGTSYADRVRADGATNHWRLGETSGTTAVDAIGGANGTISGGVTLNQPSALADGDKAMTFNGSTGKAVVTGPITLPVNCSVEAWFKPTVNPGDRVLLSSRNTGATGQTLYLGFNSANETLFVFSTAPATAVTRVSVGVWNHCVYVFNGSTITFYLNGVQDGPPVAQVRTTPSVGGFSIGWDEPNAQFFNGGIDDVIVYPRALTANEIAAHYSLGRSGLSGGNDLTTLITRYLATLSGDMTARWKQMEKNAGF